MKRNYYPFKLDENALCFQFDSIGAHKVVKKIVLFSPLQSNPGFFNLALVDQFEDGTISDLNVTNNADMTKVIATVVRVLLYFFKRYPDKLVFIEGSTPDRTRLYRIIISKELSEAEKVFNIYGLIEDKMEFFVHDQPYDSFLISLKSKENLLKLLDENEGIKT